MDKNITPVLKGSRAVEYEICPHCNSEVMEKSTSVDQDGYVYHGGDCHDKGPIDRIDMHPPRGSMQLWFDQGLFGVK